MKQKIFMLVGIPGAGKTTWSKDNLSKPNMFTKVFSSDEYRRMLLGDVNDQTKNNLVFSTLHRDMENAISKGISVCYDAVNINRKDRKHALDIFKKYPDAEKICVLFRIDKDTALKQNRQRDRVVPDEVIDRFIRKFEEPSLSEGFDSVLIVNK